ncbi:unnamed protein product [Rhizophagus irregularis]|nr:unnamed protein product [Rhizophagus irregularis]CAB5089856.1 unnamed protein product [Rhizophagus irregularis]
MCLFANYIFSLEMDYIQTFHSNVWMCKTIGTAWTLHSYRCVGLCFIFVLKKLIYTDIHDLNVPFQMYRHSGHG